MANKNLPQIWKFDFGDYSSLGVTFQKFLSNVNIFTQAVYNFMNGGVGFGNLQRTIYTETVTAGTTTPISFVNPLTVAPSGVSLVKCLLVANTPTAISNAISVANWYFDGENINILNIAGLTSGSSYNVSIEVM